MKAYTYIRMYVCTLHYARTYVAHTTYNCALVYIPIKLHNENCMVI